MAWSDTRGDWSQAKQRRNAILTDNHGRKYFAVLEKKTGDELFWQPRFKAPLIPPHTYLEKHPDEEQPLRRIINYDRWLGDIRANLAEWERKGRTAARQMPGMGINPDGTFAAAIIDIIGPRPQGVEIVLAARQGNRWALGFTEKMDPRLEKYYIPPEEERLAADEPDFSDPSEWEGLEEEEDAEAMGGKRVKVGKAGPGRRPAPTKKIPTEQALGQRRSSGTKEATVQDGGTIGPRKRSHKKKATTSPAEPAGSPS